MVFESRAMLPESTTTTTCKRAVTNKAAKDHLTAQMPRSEVAMEGSTAPWAWPCSSPCPCWWSCAMLPQFYPGSLDYPGTYSLAFRECVLRDWARLEHFPAKVGVE